ncbi:MAG: decarboxylating 6-phosphogluconate dehydrogenase [Gammaproteobacteria bacterium]|nr:decarboxylating 6-phosphogluconate dehydrogenase [Gammaproteobacteria bacterium]
MQLGFIGLGKMGMGMVARLLDGHHEVVVYNRTFEKTKIAQSKGAIPSTSVENFIAQLEKPRIIWLMLPAGRPTEDMIKQLFVYLKVGDVIIDGSNAFYQNSIQTARRLTKKGVHFLDIGVSGGIWGFKEGYCLMIGGKKYIFEQVEPILKTLAPQQGYAYVGKNGAGHFVKMVHNGIEYAMMQAYGEGFELIQAKKEFGIDLEKLAQLWNHGSVIRSWLLELVQSGFHEDPDLNTVADFVEDSGEGKWTVEEGLQNAVPLPTITQALFARFRSRQTQSFSAKLVALLRRQFGGHNIKKL